MLRWLILTLFAVASPVLAAKVTSVAMQPGVVTIATDGAVAVAHGFALGDPDRLVVDLPAVAAAPLTADGAGSVTQLRLANFSPGVVRLVVDLGAPLEIVLARAIGSGRDWSLVLTLRRVPVTVFRAQDARGRRPLPVLNNGGVAPPPTRPSDSFELPQTMFGGTGETPAKPPLAAAVPTETPVAPPASPPAVTPATRPVTASAPPAVTTPEPLPPFTPKTRAPGVRPRSGGKPLVVIDAGHGG